MANPATAYTDDSSNRAAVVAQVIAVTPNPASNTSTVTWSVNVIDGNASAGGYNGNSPDGTGGHATGSLNLSPGGVGTLSPTVSYDAGFGSYDFGSGVISSPYYPRNSGTKTATITHTSSGTAGPVYAYGSFQATFVGVPASGPVGNAAVNTDYISITPFTGPVAPGAPSLSRSTDGGTVTISSKVPTSGSIGSIAKYQYRWSYDNATWNQPASSATSSYDMATTSGSFSATSTSTVYVQTRAISTTSYAWGTGAWSSSSSVIGVATAPSSITVTQSGVTATVTCGTSTGTSITDYKVQYAASTDGGSTFGSWTSVAGGLGDSMGTVARSYTYTLPPAVTYKFRVSAVNSIPNTINSTTTTGQSAYTTSSNLYLMAVGQRYDTATSQYKQMSVGQRYDAVNGWIPLTKARRYDSSYTDPIDGSHWRPFS